MNIEQRLRELRQTRNTARMDALLDGLGKTPLMAVFTSIGMLEKSPSRLLGALGAVMSGAFLASSVYSAHRAHQLTQEITWLEAQQPPRTLDLGYRAMMGMSTPESIAHHQVETEP